MSQVTTREAALEALKILPNDSSLDEIIERLIRLENKKVIPYPAAQKLEPRLPTMVPRNGKLVSTGICELRGDDVLVQMGLLKVTLKRRDVRLKQQNGIKAPIGGVYISPSSFTKELNLRGAHVEEAIEEVRNFITEAQSLREGQIRILHGKGEGILRRVVRDYLKTDKRISSYSDANPNEGGHGVTIANIRV
jgi:DNA mismatch repair protein MutS2